MDAPRIQYAKTPDDVNIAFTVFGEGPAVVLLADPPCSHVKLEWEQPLVRNVFEPLSSHRTVVRFDMRGLGMSDRDVIDYSLDARVSDLEAVVGAAGLDSFAIVALNNAAPPAIRYALRHAARVTHLVLWNPTIAGRDQFAPSPRVDAMRELLERDWVMFTEGMIGLAFGWNREDTVRYGSFVRECVDRETLLRLYGAFFETDVTEDLPRVSAPTLVIGETETLPLARVRAAAAAVPNSQVIVFDGRWGQHPDEIAEAIRSFLGDAPNAPSGMAASLLPQGTAIILFLDIAGSTALTTQLGDAPYREKERQLDGALRAAISEAGGTPVEGKVLGDGVMAVFSSASNAIDTALACGEQGRHAGLPLHAGIHAGDVIREGNNVHGGAVQVAARIADASAPGEVWVSDIVRGLARTSAGVSFEDRGERELKGVSEPVRVFAVRGTE